MQKLVKYAVAVALILFPVLGAHAQQEQLSATRGPGDHLHYTVTLSDGDVSKVSHVSMAISIVRAEDSNQPGGQSRLAGDCQKSSDQRVWDCDVVIPQNVVDGDYQPTFVQVMGGTFYQNYNQQFDVPTVRVKNPNTFTAPSKVTVKQNL